MALVLADRVKETTTTTGTGTISLAGSVDGFISRLLLLLFFKKLLAAFAVIVAESIIEIFVGNIVFKRGI